MSTQHFEELASEIHASLQDGAVTDKDRSVLEQVHTELQSAKTLTEGPHRLRDKITQAIEQLESKHPRLVSLLSESLEQLSDIGI